MNEPGDIERATREFQSRFNCQPTVVATAPGRVNLIGEHLDYNDGFVLPMAIERRTVVAMAAKVSASTKEPTTPNNTATITSLNLESTVEFSIQRPDQTSTAKGKEPTLENWGCHLEGVVAGFLDLGIAVPAFNAVIASDIPIGAGLSSSAALQVAMATALESLTASTLEPTQKARLCQTAEQRFAGVSCGIMDQFTSVHANADSLILLDCRLMQHKQIPFAGDDISVLITNSNVQRSLHQSQYDDRGRECDSALENLYRKQTNENENETETARMSWQSITITDLESVAASLTPPEFKRARHVVTEIGRTQQMADAIKDGRWAKAGQLMYDSHDSLCYDFQVSCPQLDQLVQHARSIGIQGGMLGCRMTGAGFGGCTVSLIERQKADPIVRKLHRLYHESTGLTAESFTSRAATGCKLITRC